LSNPISSKMLVPASAGLIANCYLLIASFSTT
jgi:hypothetical protein